MRNGHKVTMMAVILLVSATALWAAPTAVTLEMKGQPGQELKYATDFEMSMDIEVTDPASGGQVFALAPRMQANAVTISRVAHVSENGDLTMRGRVESFDFTLDVADLHARLAIVGPDGGPPQLIKLPEIPIGTVVAKDGTVLAIEGLDALPIPPIPMPGGTTLNIPEMISNVMEEFSQPVFPDRPVSAGDTWEWEMVIDPLAMAEMMGTPLPPEAKAELGNMSFPIKNTSRLVAFETVNGIECAKIEAVAPWELSMPAGPPGTGMMVNESGTTTVLTWFDHAAGRTVREVVSVGVTMRVGNDQMTVVRMDLQIAGESELQ